MLNGSNRNPKSRPVFPRRIENVKSRSILRTFHVVVKNNFRHCLYINHILMPVARQFVRRPSSFRDFSFQFIFFFQTVRIEILSPLLPPYDPTSSITATLPPSVLTSEQMTFRRDLCILVIVEARGQ